MMIVLRHTIDKLCKSTCNQFHFKQILIRGFAKKKARAKESPTEKALQHFDDLYGLIFKDQWPSLRLGLLSPSKHVALINNTHATDETEELLRCIGALDLRTLLKNAECEYEEKGNRRKGIEKVEYTSVYTLTQDKDTLEELHLGKTKTNDEDLINNDHNSGTTGENFEVDEEFEADTNDSYLSMQEALSHSRIDVDRLIDPSGGVSESSLHEFVPVTELRSQDHITEGDYVRFYQLKNDFPVNIEEDAITYPENLKVYSFPRGDISCFPAPKPLINNVLNYYVLDGASVLTVLALGLKAEDRVLDMCAAPGGKSLTMVQTLLPKYIVCNDSSISRCKRLQKVLDQYLFHTLSWRDKISITRSDGRTFMSDKSFNKILVDVPCTNDRISANICENNIFMNRRIRERLSLPEYQVSLLEKALTLVEPGGTVVYSTCTLSPIQNDGVVNIALQNVWKDHYMEFTVKSLESSLRRISTFYRFGFNIGLKYGSLVIPFVPVNFGPMYFCKLVKNK